MILFCDTSALIKLYIQEIASDEMQALASSASMVAVCRIAWAESMAVLARRVRENPVDQPLIDQVRDRLRKDWVSYAIIEVTQALVELAGDHADAFALRGYDSIQLAAACLLRQVTQEDLRFACFDTRLRKAAQTLGMV